MLTNINNMFSSYTEKYFSARWYENMEKNFDFSKLGLFSKTDRIVEIACNPRNNKTE